MVERSDPSAPLFSVIIPTFDRSGLLEEAVASVLGQTVDSFECLVVDDGNPAPISIPDDPRVSVIRRATNAGTAAARNTGLDRARARYVTFLDDDDLFAPDRLELALAGHERADISVCWTCYHEGPFRPGRMLDGDVSGVLFEHLVPNMGQTSVRREVMPRFDERLRTSEDVEWWIRACQQLEVATIPKWGLRFRRHLGARHLKSSASHAEARTEILAWHHEFFSRRPRASAFQWRRIGLLRADAGECRLARAAYLRSLRARPTIRTLGHLVRPSRCHDSSRAAAT